MTTIDRRQLGSAIGAAINIAVRILVAKKGSNVAVSDITKDLVVEILETTQKIHEDIIEEIIAESLKVVPKDELIKGIKACKTREQKLEFHSKNTEAFKALSPEDREEVKKIFLTTN